MIDLNKIMLGAAAGAASNAIIGGIGARIAMRIVVLLLGGQPGISLDGTLGILLLAAMLGTVLGVVTAYLHGWAGRRWRRADWALGGLLMLLITALFFANREGELALLTPWQGALLFAPLALLSTLASGWAYERLRRTRLAATERRAPAAWLVSYTIASLLALTGMISLAGSALRLPRVAWHVAAMANAGANLTGTYALQQMLGLLFVLTYLLLTSLLFWLANSQPLRAAAIGCLLVAAGLFHSAGPREELWGRGLAANMIEGGVALIGAAILAMVYWRLFTGSPGNVRRRPPAISLLLLAGLLAGLVVQINAQPHWGVLRQPPQVTLFSVTLYLLPWLLLPLGLLLSMHSAPRSASNSSALESGSLATVD